MNIVLSGEGSGVAGAEQVKRRRREVGRTPESCKWPRATEERLAAAAENGTSGGVAQQQLSAADVKGSTPAPRKLP